MYFVRRKLDLYSLSTVIRFYSLARKTHYDVLKLRKNCSDKEIKEAFFRLSKEYHPDKNKDSAAQDKFVQIVEAYNVLSKPGSRARYDSMTEVGGSPYVYKTHNPYNTRRNQYQYTYNYEQTSKSQYAGTENKSYYGISGMKKVPNYVIIMVCCGFAMIGCLLQMFVIREMYVAQRQQAREKSKLLAEELERVQAAKQNRNEVQTRLLLEKIVTAANPTVATASLGQALANEKK